MVAFTWKMFATSSSVAMSSGRLSSLRGDSSATRRGASTVTVIAAVARLPPASVAVQVTVLAPKLLPGTAAQDTVTAWQESFAVGRLNASGAPVQLPTTVLDPRLALSNTGAFVSTTT